MSWPVWASRACESAAALALAAAVIVIVVTPDLLESPNVLATPAALVVGAGCVGAVLAGVVGRLAAGTVSVAGLILSLLWYWLASDGFGQGTLWWDDMVEAGVLAGLFLTAGVLLLLARATRRRLA